MQSKPTNGKGLAARMVPRVLHSDDFFRLTVTVSMIQFCIRCGTAVSLRVPEGDALPRHVCNACGHIHYLNPRMVVGCIAEHAGRILLCRRAIAPREGFWTLPAGFLENGESPAIGAARETREEACAEPHDLIAFAMASIPHISQIHFFYRATLPGGQHAPGIESLETGLFGEAEIPWTTLAFPSVSQALQRYFADRTRGHFDFHEWSLPPQAALPG